MDKNKWKSPSSDALKTAYQNRGKYPDSNNRKYIFTPTGDALLWKVTDKSHKIRLLPVHPDDNINFYGMTVHIHTNVGVNGDQYLCPKKMLNKPCPICEQQAQLWETEPDMAKDLYPQSRYLVWVVDLSVEPNKQRTQVWSCPRTAMDDILGVSYKKATDEIINLANLEEGYALYFDREKKGNTTFSIYKNFQLDEKATPAKEEWVNEIKSFSEVIEYASYDEIKNAFLGLGDSVPEKREVLTNVETTVKIETIEETTEKSTDSTTSIDDMDRDQLEALAITVLSEDYEESEIEEMGTKKLRRLVKEVVESKVGSSVDSSVRENVGIGPEGGRAVDPREALKQKLRDRIK